MRVGFVELHGKDSLDGHLNGPYTETNGASARIQRQLEMSWPIHNHLKNENADSLFLWIGTCIAEVVQKGCETFNLPSDQPLSLGVAFSFPMEQNSVSEATLMGMGKGFAISDKLNLGARLRKGYEQAKTDTLPPIQVAAIANDSVSTLVSFIFKYGDNVHQKASMGLILGTGCNATIPLKLSQLHPSKRSHNVSVLPNETIEDVRVAVNTEWSINGTAPPLEELDMISKWDKVLDSQNEIPGFQPLEYMTAGRYLGELGRIMFIDYMVHTLEIPRESIPHELLQRHSMSTAFLSHFKPLNPSTLLSKLTEEFPTFTSDTSLIWTEDLAEVLYHIAKAIEVRAAGIMAAAIMALLTLGGELPSDPKAYHEVNELGVGYTGGCIVHFQDYLSDCQDFIDQLLEKWFGGTPPVKVVLSPCHDGGITGAGILVAAALGSENTEI